MKQTIIYLAAAALVLSSCGTYTGQGAYVGTSLGGILGSAIGGISDGPRGHDVGTVVGMVGGAIIGGAVGSAADRKQEAKYEQYKRERAERAQARTQQIQQQEADAYDGVFDESNSGDDRIYDFNGSDYIDQYQGMQPSETHFPHSSSMENRVKTMRYSGSIEVKNARFLDDNMDGALSRGEVGKVIFEVYNRSQQTLYDVQPLVVETSGNKHLYISPGMHIEKIEPGRGIRYTAMIKADNRLGNGTAKICVSVMQGDGRQISKVNEFSIPTRK